LIRLAVLAADCPDPGSATRICVSAWHEVATD
jgi:hypothetical protein